MEPCLESRFSVRILIEGDRELEQTVMQHYRGQNIDVSTCYAVDPALAADGFEQFPAESG